MNYYNFLKILHEKLKPEKYLEIGVRNGDSLYLADEKTFCIGIDPLPLITKESRKNVHIFDMTSDDFFEHYKNDSQLLKNIDLAFIDGMHLFEYVLRDFINIEKCCKKESFIVLHDTNPKDKITSQRNRTTDFWTGDVYKIILILKNYRPDLKIYNSDASPSGLTIVGNLNPKSVVLSENYNKIVDEFYNFEYENIETDKKTLLDIMPTDYEILENYFNL